MSKERFDKTVDVLVKAYLNGTIQPGNPCGCAIGNMIAAACGYKFERKSRGCGDLTDWWEWENDISEGFDWYLNLRPEKRKSHHIAGDVIKGSHELSLIGYSLAEIDAIEKSFESAARPVFEDEDAAGFAGLLSVVDTLAEIDGISLEETETARKLFVK
jgi:hypothetical protein